MPVYYHNFLHFTGDKSTTIGKIEQSTLESLLSETKNFSLLILTESFKNHLLIDHIFGTIYNFKNIELK